MTPLFFYILVEGILLGLGNSAAQGEPFAMLRVNPSRGSGRAGVGGGVGSADGIEESGMGV
jgi:hypothetical protein